MRPPEGNGDGGRLDIVSDDPLELAGMVVIGRSNRAPD